MMTDRMDHEFEERGLSARQLVLMFLAGVAVCAVFFAAGFLVGYNERASKEMPSTERVAPSSSVIPPNVNPPMQSKAAENSEPPAQAKPAEPTPVREEHARATPPPPAAEPMRPAAQKATETPGRYVLQVAASSSRQDAQDVAKGLKSRGFPAFVVTPEQAGAQDLLYRVQIGPYPTRQAAEQAKPRLEQAGFKAPFIKQE